MSRIACPHEGCLVSGCLGGRSSHPWQLRGDHTQHLGRLVSRLPTLLWTYFPHHLTFPAISSAHLFPGKCRGQRGILSCSAAAPLPEIFSNWTEILFENLVFLLHFGLELENLSYWTEINLFKNRKEKMPTEIFFQDLSILVSNRNQFFPKK